ncbi:MAG: VanW family protein, partial [Acidimicrobiia bacterium]
MRRIWIALAAAVSTITVVALGLALLDANLSHHDRVAPQVYAADVALSNLAESDAVAALDHYEQRLLSVAQFSVADQVVELQPTTLELRVDAGPVVAQAMEVRPSEGLISDLSQWLDGYAPIELDVPVDINMASLDAMLDHWDRIYVNEPPSAGGIEFDKKGKAVAVYPVPGRRIARQQATEAILAALASPNRSLVEIPLESDPPQLDEADIDAAVVAANRLVDSKVELSLFDEQKKLVYSKAQLRSAVRTEIDPTAATRLRVELDPEVLVSKVRGATVFDSDPVDARFSFSEEAQEVSMVPGSPARTVDLDAIPAAVTIAALGSGTGMIPMADGEPANFTTAQAEAMGPITKLSEFTTNHWCCASRNINIRTMADAIDNTIVQPGETFSINDHVGKRTKEKGYVPAGAIIAGKLYCCDNPQNIGGGTSQFGTTFYNAVFFSCLEEVDHKPHSWYFSRYPYGREATMGWPGPDVAFRNDTESIVYIDTSYTGKSITVAFYGNHEGRECSSIIKRRGGNTVTSIRVITYPDGTFKREAFTWTYRK